MPLLPHALRGSLRPAALGLLLSVLVAACGGDEPAAPGAGNPAAVTPKATPGKSDGKAAPKGEASAKLAFQTGRQLLLKGDPEKAAQEFQRATELDPKMAEAHFELGKLRLHLSSQTVGSQARDLDVLESGLASMERAVELDPQQAYYWFWLARGNFRRDQDQTAKPIEMLTKALALDPDNGPAWKLLGRVQIQAGDNAAAKQSLQTAAEKMPKDGNSRFYLGNVLEVLGETEAARGVYEESIRLDPSNAKAYESLVKVCARLGDAEGEARANAGLAAWGEYQQKLNRRRVAVNRDPSDGAAVRRLGEAYFEVGKWEESLEWFMKAIHIDPKDALAHLYCGVARLNLEDHENALNHLKEAEFLAPDNLDPKLELLRLYTLTKDEKGFAETLGATEEAAAEDGYALFALGETCQELAHADDAARLLGKAAALGVTAAAPEPAPEPEADGGG